MPSFFDRVNTNLGVAWDWYKENGENFYCASVASPHVQNSRWIQDAIKRPGALRAKAQAARAMTKRDTINVGWLQKMAAQRDDIETARQARLALTLRRMRK